VENLRQKEEEVGGGLKKRGGGEGQKNGGGKVFIPFGTWKVFGLGFSEGRVISFVVSKCLKFHSPPPKKKEKLIFDSF
jgi:hypothetical protein